MYISERVDTRWTFMACRSDVFLQYLLMPRDYSEFNLIIIVRGNEWPVGIAHNYTALFRSILGVLSPFRFSLMKHNKLTRFSYSVLIFPPVFPHRTTALYSCYNSRFLTSVGAP